ncbi:MAG TPA: hypothetical protein VJR47_03145 [Stellaceae bacterium]|nr:hypothetical protein [Stellaceae bacterium]
MVIGQNEAAFLRQQAERLRMLAEGCSSALRAELLTIAADFERRAGLLDDQPLKD